MTADREDRARWWQGRLSRRITLQRAALGSMSLAAVAALACGKTEEVRPAVSQPKPGGILNHAGGEAGSYDTRGTTLDPHINPPVAAMGFRLFYQGLLGYHLRTLEVEPELAQKWEQPSLTEFVFSLQRGVTWHDKPPANGRELTADDVVFSLNRAQTDEPRFQNRSLLATVDKIQALDRATVKISTKSPDAALLSKLGADGLLILAPEVVEKAGRFATADAVVGTGPFVMKSVEDNVGAEYVRNPAYWKPGLPYLDGVRTKHFREEQQAYAAFLAGQLDVTRLTGTDVKHYLARQGAGYIPDWYKDMSFVFATPNVTAKPMDDTRVTRALRLLMDHYELKTTWGDVQTGRSRYGSILCTSLDAWDLTEEEYTKLIFWKQAKDEAVQQALALLSAAGFTRENPLTFELAHTTTPGVATGAEIIHAQWRRLGQGVVQANLKPFELAQALLIQARGTFAYGIWGLAGAAGTDPDPWITTLYESKGARNRMFLKDPKLDAMIERQRLLFDRQQRKAAVREIVSYMAEHSPGVLLTNPYRLNAVNPKVRDHASEFNINGRQYEWIWLEG